MKALLEYLELNDMVTLEKATNLLEFNLSNILNRVHNRNNPVKDFATQSGEGGQVEPQTDIANKMEEALKRLQAARTGLGLANKLKDPDQRAMHKSRIMKNLNLLRRIVQHIEEELAKGEPKSTSTPLQDREPVGNGQEPEPYMGGMEGMRENVNPELVKAVKDLKHAKKELEKNPFGKSKKIKKTKDEPEGKTVTESYQPQKGHKVHLGFGAKGGAGFRGRVTKVEGDKVHIKNDEGKTYSGPIKYVTPEDDKE